MNDKIFIYLEDCHLSEKANKSNHNFVKCFVSNIFEKNWRRWCTASTMVKVLTKLSSTQHLHEFLREVAISKKGTPLNGRHYVQRALAWSRKTRHLAFQRWILRFLNKTLTIYTVLACFAALKCFLRVFLAF